MTLIRVPDDDRPLLPAALAARGLRAVAGRPLAPAAIWIGRRPPGPATPWLALAGSEADAVAALDAGAADAVTPATGDALVAARVAALLRRTAMVLVGDLTLDLIAREAWRAGRRLALLPREYAILALLARAAGTTVSRAALREGVWGREFDPGTNVIEVHVSRLRAALDRGSTPMLLTDKGRGYRLVATTSIAGPKPAL